MTKPKAPRKPRKARPPGADADLARTSRDGDQFHYLRGARLALEMLPTDSELVMVTVEGVSTPDDIKDGLNVIDLVLYYGSSDPARATKLRYRQFKHSTLHAETDWTASGLTKTLKGFAERYKKQAEKFGADDVAGRVRYEFETNRPVADEVKNALADLASGIASDRSAYLRSILPLKGKALAAFAALVDILDRAPGFMAQRTGLVQDLRSYLPDNDQDAPIRLKDLVARKATSEFKTDPQITRHDVLTALDAGEGELFPAPCLIETLADVVDREQAGTIETAIATATAPLIIEADGGVGKSVFAATLSRRATGDGRAFLYDCFGNGQYRSASKSRHRARDGLVQLANEMAAAGLCDPLIPTSKADVPAYLRAFMARVKQAADYLEETGAQPLLIVIDAADNAQIAADEISDGPSFPRLLLRESWPAHVRLVLTSRPYRVHYLDPPPLVRRIELEPFTRSETARHFRGRFPDANEADIDEFHRLTSQNPRVQSKAMAAGTDVASVLKALGPTPKSVEDMIADLLEQAFATVRDQAGRTEKTKLDLVCAALATLRPFIPLQILADTADVPVALVRSMVTDLDRPLLVRDDTVQFRDEPTESWFQERFRPGATAMSAFIDRLKPQAASSAYVAAALPQLLLEAGQFDTLIELALSGDALPVDDDLVRRDVELQRLRFALKAALRKQAYAVAAKLALKAGNDVAADHRQNALLSANTDLATNFLPPEQIQDLVARRLVDRGQWPGSHHAYEASMLSGQEALKGDARAQLRYANEWLDQWSRRQRSRADDDYNDKDTMSDEDIAEFALAELNLHGPASCARRIANWRPPEVPFLVGKRTIPRLVDAGRFDEIDAIALAGRRSLGLQLAIFHGLGEVGRSPPKRIIDFVGAIVSSRHVKLEEPTSQSYHDRDLRLETITAIVVAAARKKTMPRAQLVKLLDRHLPNDPPHGLAARYEFELPKSFAFIRAYALRGALARKTIGIESLAHASLKKKIETNDRDSETERFKEDVGALLPWHGLWAECQLGRVPAAGLASAVDAAIAAMGKARQGFYRESDMVPGHVARVWGSILADCKAPGTEWQKFENWQAGLERPLPYEAYVDIARRLSACGDSGRALDYGVLAYDLAKGEKDHAESQSQRFVEIARAVLPSGRDDASAYFDAAIRVADGIGDENLYRWETLTRFAAIAGTGSVDEPELAYRFARGAEFTYRFVVRDKHFDWNSTIAALTKLSPRSALPIASRWADRRFGREERDLPDFIDALPAGALDPRLALSVVAMRTDWDETPTLEAALAKGSSLAERREIAKPYLRYAPFLEGKSELWRRRQELLDRAGVEASLLDERRDRAEQSERDASERERKRQREQMRYARPQRRRRTPNETPDWDAIFDGVDVFQATDMETAAARLREHGLGYHQGSFFSAAIERVAAGSEARFLQAQLDRPPLGFYDLGGLLDALPDGWRKRISVPPLIKQLVLQSLRDNCHSVSIHEHYQMLPLSRAEKESGLSRETLVSEVIKACGERELPNDPGGLFQLAALLSVLVTPEEAASVLDGAVSSLDALADPDVGDGPWDGSLSPPASVDEGLAGYLWAALSAPEASRRWCAAHAVRWIARVGGHAVLDPLIALATRGTGDVFGDRTLRFYDKHGLLWLVIALARAAKENGETVARHEEFLRSLANRKNGHVVVRHFAARALLDLADQSLVALTASERAALDGINRSTLPTRPQSEAPREIGDGWGDWGDEPKTFHFDYDFSKSFMKPFGRCFGKSRAEMQVEAAKIIRDDWKLPESGDYKEDVRAMQKFFRDDHSRRSDELGRVSDLREYLSWHAGMTLVGELLETDALFEDDDDSWNALAGRLKDHMLHRADGLWLFDMRDPVPAKLAAPDKHQPEKWLASLTPRIAEREIHLPTGRMVVSGRWTSFDGDKRLKVAVHSALVSVDRSRALVRALQCNGDPMNYCLPDFEYSSEIDEGGYQLKGWLSEAGDHSGLDARDPWVGGIASRTEEPARPFIPLLGLHAGHDGRSWIGNSEVAILAERWSDGPEDDNNKKREHGKRLSASPDSIAALTRSTGLNFIVEVSVTRASTASEADAREKKNEKAITQILLFGKGPGARRP